MNIPPLAKKALAEFLGVALFLTSIAGSFRNSSNPFSVFALSITLGLAILVTASISGGHLNPAVSVYFYSRRELSLVELVSYIGAQVAGAAFGVLIANQMWQSEIMLATTNDPAMMGDLVSEVFVTGGLVWLVARLATTGRGAHIPAAVGLWVLAASIFSSSGAQANPAVSIGLMLLGQGTAQAAGFILAQLLGMLIAAVFIVIFADKPKAEYVAAVEAPAEIVSLAKKPAARKPAAKKPAAKKPAAK
ncbi:MAG: aquaporin [Rhodoluna sp.]|nr:aquaporin [Rhodoluna sp.]